MSKKKKKRKSKKNSISKQQQEIKMLTEASEESMEVLEEPEESLEKTEEIPEEPEESLKESEEVTQESVQETPKKRIWLKWLVALTAVLLVGFLSFWLYEDSLVYKVCNVEAGVAVEVSDFLKKVDEEAYFTDASDVIDITVPGVYNLVIKKGFFEHECTLHIQDTIAPQVEVQPVKIEYGETCEPSDFVTSIKDATATKVTFGEEPDYSGKEPQNVQIMVTDIGNNTTVVEAELIIAHVVKTLDWEAGSEPPVISDFVLAGTGGKILTNLAEVDFNKIAEHSVKVKLNDTIYDVQMNIVDTIAPVLELQDVTGYVNCKRTVEEFVAHGEDITELQYSFEKAPDLKVPGTQKITVVATDEGGNRTAQEANLVLIEDTEAPVIVGAKDMTAYIGEKVSYKAKVRVEDNCQEANLVVDSSSVNMNAEGIYPITYTATDCSGNSTAETVNLTVKKRAYDIDEVNALADSVLAKILKDGMSQYDKALAIFNYTKGNISYINHSEKGDYVRSAYEGLKLKRGDCYVYASTAKVLLTRAGITNMDIARIPSGSSMHYWNLVDIGDGQGWYHFDTTPRKDRPVIFLWNDQQIKDYSDRHNNSHNYDRSLYPVIN